MTEKVTMRWEVERETAERDYVRHECFTLDITGTFHYGPACATDPGEASVELERVTFRGEPFSLTNEEERALVEWWTEDLRHGD